MREKLWTALAVVVGLVILAAAFGGCASDSTPSHTLRRYCDTAKAGDWLDNYNLFTSDFQHQLGSAEQYAAAESSVGIKDCTPDDRTLNFATDNKAHNVASEDVGITYSDGFQEVHATFELLRDEYLTWKISEIIHPL